MNTKSFHERSSLMMALLSGALLAFPACEAEPTDEALDETELDEPEGEEAEDEDDEFRVWTQYTSDGLPPVTCSGGYYMHGAQCTGTQCDNVRMDCYNAGIPYGSSYWTSYFSEEGTGATDERHCGGGQFVTGMACMGMNCDRLSLKCTKAMNRWHSNCQWSNWYSNEDPAYYAPQGYYVKGMECDGTNCDEMRYYVCRMVQQ